MSTITTSTGVGISAYAKVVGDQPVKCAITADGDVEIGFGRDLDLCLSQAVARQVHQSLGAVLDRPEPPATVADVRLVVDEDAEQD
ncbi:hypothetical protein JOF41_002408 [Saccharothrix coeruleofusca]|uniref:hypothetical protein n=1 Tax=Saccharothrix coeruleofusca TaxID=33919 RepID=UPI001AE68B97|nr:hypothetical protein [Saccharothrix coeruleofusca]MBP2336230.1 hypothetical protein [Saccharothrix coeruleofusca]